MQFYHLSLVHKPSGRMLDIYTDMNCICVNTAQDFPSYGKMLFNEDVIKITEISTPVARFAITDHQASSVSGENTSTSELEYVQDELEEMVAEVPSTQTNHKVSEIGLIIGKSHTVYKKNSGICIRPQLFPDAVKHVIFFNTSYCMLYAQH